MRVTIAVLTGIGAICSLGIDYSLSLTLLLLTATLLLWRRQPSLLRSLLIGTTIWALVISIAAPLSLCAFPQTFQLNWTYSPRSNAYKEVAFQAQGNTAKPGWFGRETFWGYKVPVSSSTHIVLITNDDRRVTARVEMNDDGKSERTLVYEDGTYEPLPPNSLRNWLRNNNVELPNWDFGFHTELNNLYSAIYAASHGTMTRPPIFTQMRNTN